MHVSAPQFFTNALHNRSVPSTCAGMDKGEQELIAWINSYKSEHGSLPTLQVLQNYQPVFYDETFISEPATHIEQCYRDTLKKRIMRSLIALMERDLEIENKIDTKSYIEKIEELKDTEKETQTVDLFTERKTEDIPLTKTGLFPLDCILNGGFRPATLNVFSARPAVGKTWLLSSLATTLVLNKKRVLYITSEMLPREIKLRIDARLLGVNYSSLYTEEQKEELNTLLECIKDAGANIVFNDKAQVTVQEIDTLRAKHNIDVVIVDNLYLLKTSEGGKLWERVKAIADELKALALSSGCIVLASTQLNRDSSNDMSDRLAYSDSILQDADLLAVLEREQMDTNMKMQIVKNRWGFSGAVVPLTLDFNKSIVKVRENVSTAV